MSFMWGAKVAFWLICAEGRRTLTGPSTVLHRYPLLSRLSLMLACLASLAAGLFFSAGLAVRLELAARLRPAGWPRRAWPGWS